LIYSNTLGTPFVFDDLVNIQNNTHIRLSRLTLGEIIEAGFGSGSSNRPVAKISFALNYYFHQYPDPCGDGHPALFVRKNHSKPPDAPFQIWTP
jgi:Uma2 family endonuclease